MAPKYIILIITAKIIIFIIPITLSDSAQSKTDSTPSPELEDDNELRNFYVRDPIKSKQLAFWELSLASGLRNIQADKKLTTKCQRYLSKYLTEFDRDTKAVKGQAGVKRAAIVAENPILVFRMVTRLYIVVMNYLKNSCKNQNEDKLVTEVVEDTFITAGLTPPTDKDANNAIRGLLYIQYIYGLNTSDLIFGKLGDVNTDAQLYFDDCLYLISEAAFSGKEEAALAYQWLVAAEARLADEVNSGTVRNKKELGYARELVFNLTRLKTMEDLHKKFMGKRQETFDEFSDYSAYAPCRGESGTPLGYQAMLHCFQENGWDPYFFINPLRIEIISGNPLPIILQFYDFVSDKAINAIRRKYTSFGNNPETVVLSPDNEFASDNDKILKELSQKIRMVMGRGWTRDETQVLLNTRLSGFRNVHQILRTSPLLERKKNLLATVLIYMTDVKLGGFTSFFKLNTFTKPVKGSVVLFTEFGFKGVKETRVVQDSCPVLLGYNEWARKWLY